MPVKTDEECANFEELSHESSKLMESRRRAYENKLEYLLRTRNANEIEPQLHLIPYDTLESLTLALEYGAAKYGEWNWTKGIYFSKVYDAALRHLAQWMHQGDDGEEGGIHHLYHALVSVIFLVYFTNNIDRYQAFDDRRIEGVM